MATSIVNMSSKILYCCTDVVKSGWTTLRSIPISKAVKLAFVGLALLANPIHQVGGRPIFHQVGGESICIPQSSRELAVTGRGPASYLKNSTFQKFDAWEFYASRFKDIPGIIKNRYEGPDEGLCERYVSDKIGFKAYVDGDRLIEHGYEIVPNPEINDVIVYFKTPSRVCVYGNGKEYCRNEEYTHIGIVTAVENSEVWVKSKWGRWPVFEHLEEAVPAAYGNAVMYFRKK